MLVDGEYAYLPQQWVRRESDEEFVPWDGFAGYGCQLYDNCMLRGQPVKQLNSNTKLTVLWEAEDVFAVQVGDVSAETIRTTPVPSSSGGNSGSSSSGGGAWTPPVL